MLVQAEQQPLWSLLRFCALLEPLHNWGRLWGTSTCEDGHGPCESDYDYQRHNTSFVVWGGLGFQQADPSGRFRDRFCTATASIGEARLRTEPDLAHNKRRKTLTC
jgi:hypothetical protein